MLLRDIETLRESIKLNRAEIGKLELTQADPRGYDNARRAVHGGIGRVDWPAKFVRTFKLGELSP